MRFRRIQKSECGEKKEETGRIREIQNRGGKKGR